MVGSIQDEYLSMEHKSIGLYMDAHHVFYEVEPNITLLFRLISCSAITLVGCRQPLTTET
jgi:hypothetical protein